MVGFLSVKTLEDARRLLEEHWHPRPVVAEVPLEEAGGRILAEDVTSKMDLPPFDRAAVDGYAVRAADTFGADEEAPVELMCIGSVQAGDHPRLSVRKRQCVEIATGAPMPRGADAVAMVEYTTSLKNVVKVYRAVAPGENVVERGSEIKRGTVVLRAGRRLTPPAIGALAAIGMGRVKILKPPRVAVISSGAELVRPGHKLGKGKVYDINGPAICEAIKTCGCEPVYLGIVRDEAQQIRRAIERGLSTCDIVVVSGGSSAGKGDIMPKVVDGLGKPGLLVHGLAMKPGKPTIVAVVGGKPVFGLPGYPVSALMVFDQLVAPYLRELSGIPRPKQERLTARLSRRILLAKGRRALVPVRLARRDGELLAEPLLKGSGAITSLSAADGYIEVPLGKEMVEEGEIV
ncbi:MAG: molybdopterin-binding protein, partial [Hadesarchaea archaeon]|nr:molybdopterin-binding protein [Hadesarchaea archaeon]